MSGLPAAVRVREVGPRDGFQNEREVIPTADKVALINALARTGLRRLEVTSFVRADVIPQLADAAEVLAAIEVPGTVSVSVLVPNERGLDGALRHRDRIDEINVFLSASETHNRHNVNRSVAESIAGLARVLERARAAGLRCEGVISTSFGCPYEGHVAVERVLDIARALRDAGAQEVGFGDTTGMANPRQVRAFFERARSELGDSVELTAHFHNTRGQGLANVLAALEAGIESFEFHRQRRLSRPASRSQTILPADRWDLADLRSSPYYSHRRRGHAHGHLAAQRLRRSLRRGHGIRPRFQAPDHRWRPRWLFRTHPLRDHVEGDEPFVY